jgi:hypothetical protein
MALKMSELRTRLGLGESRKAEIYNSQAYVAARERMREVETQKAVMLILSDSRGLNLIRP